LIFLNVVAFGVDVEFSIWFNINLKFLASLLQSLTKWFLLVLKFGSDTSQTLIAIWYVLCKEITSILGPDWVRRSPLVSAAGHCRWDSPLKD
jgi:hypothetical protein